MPNNSEQFHFVVIAAIALMWLAFAAMMLIRQRSKSPPDAKRDPTSRRGLIIQGIGYLIVWIVPRTAGTPIIPVGVEIQIALGVMAIVMMIASVWFVLVAVRTLGREWSLTARLVEGHRLVTTGPYHVVRNPIYTGMLGMLIATGIAFGHWIGLLAAMAVYIVGTMIRIRSEEKLLRGEFGVAFEDYRRRVPALVPFVF